MTADNTPEWHNYVPLKWVPSKPLIDPATLTQHQRQLLWNGIKQADPALADMLKNDQTLAELKQTFNGTIVFEVDEVHHFMQVGQKGS